MSVTVEKSLRVFHDKEGVSILVAISADGAEFGIEVRTTDTASQDWFGPVRIPLGDKAFTKALARAIDEMAEEIK